jgi:hypothetical protein
MSLTVVYSDEDLAEGALVLPSIMVLHPSSVPSPHSILSSVCFFFFLPTHHTLHSSTYVKCHVTKHDRV